MKWHMGVPGIKVSHTAQSWWIIILISEHYPHNFESLLCVPWLAHNSILKPSEHL